MFVAEAARSFMLPRVVVALLSALLVASLVAPVAALGADPSAEPTPEATSAAEVAAPAPEPTSTATPTPADTAPAATAEPSLSSPDPTPAATPEPTPEPTAEPTVEPAPVAVAPVPSAAPTIASDKADYAPGELVTLTGAAWAPGESVHIYVNDDNSSSWSRNVDVVADANGAISDQFTLPGWFVAIYTVVANAQSGVATTTFTDCNVNVRTDGTTTEEAPITWKRFANITCTGGGSPNVTFNAATGGNGTGIAGGASSTESLRLTAGAIPGYTFVNWSNGDFINPNVNPACLVGDNNTQNVRANYVVNTIAATSLSVAPATGTFGGAVNLSATLTAAGSGVSGKSISFSLNGSSVGSAMTNASGVASLTASLTGINAGTYAAGISASFAGDSGYSLSNGTASLTVNKAAGSVTISNIPASATFGGSFTPTFTKLGDGTTSVASLTSLTCTVASGVVSFVGAGTCTLRASVAAGTNYNAATGADQSFTIGKAAGSVTINNIPVSATFGGSFTPTFTKLGDGTASVVSLTSLTCSESGGVVSFIGAGTCTLRASVTAGSNYNAATGTDQSFTIGKADATCVINGYSGTYDGDAHGASGSCIGVDGSTVLAGLSLGASFTNVPGGTATWTFTDVTGNYNNRSGTAAITIGQASSTVTVTCTAGAPYIYDGSAQTPCTAQATGVGMSPVDVTGSLSYTNNVNAGAAGATASWTGDVNHTGSTGIGGFTVNKRSATWTTNASSKTYGDPDPVGLTSGSGTNFLAADGVTATYSRTPGETVAGNPYHISATLSSSADALANYDITNVGASFTINKRSATWTTNANSKILGSADPSPLTTGSGTNFVAADGVTASYSRVSGELVGGYHISATLSSSVAGALDNYTIANAGSTFSIVYASNGTCAGSPGHQVLQPINANYLVDLSVFKQGSTIPVKFRVCDANGVSIGTPGVVSSFLLTSRSDLPPDQVVDEIAISTTPDIAFRWSSTDQQWIFNLSTKGLAKNVNYVYTIILNDGSKIEVHFGLK